MHSTILQSGFWDNFTSIKTPLALAGIFAAIIFLIARQILKNYQTKEPNQRHGFQLARTVLKYLFILSLLAMGLGFIGYLFQPRSEALSPLPTDETAAEAEALRLQDQVLILLGSYANMDESPADRRETIENGPKLAEQLLLIRDDQLRPAYRILKFEYSMYAYTMASAAEGNDEIKLLYLTKALDLGKTTEELVADVKRNPFKNKDYEKAMKFTVNDNVDDRINYLTAVCLCQKVEVSDDADVKRQAHDRLAEVSPAFLQRYPVKPNAEFKDCN